MYFISSKYLIIMLTVVCYFILHLNTVIELFHHLHFIYFQCIKLYLWVKNTIKCLCYVIFFSIILYYKIWLHHPDSTNIVTLSCRYEKYKKEFDLLIYSSHCLCELHISYTVFVHRCIDLNTDPEHHIINSFKLLCLTVFTQDNAPENSSTRWLDPNKCSAASMVCTQRP